LKPFLQNEKAFSWRDVLALLFFLILFWSVVKLFADLDIPISQAHIEHIDLSLNFLPYYLLRSTFRMFLAYLASLIFTLTFGYWAYKSKRASSFIITSVDILQSVPVLGFLSVSVTGFMALFPNQLMGVELASLFAIFTGQVWNMTLSFYNSLTTLPSELKESSEVFHLNPWQRFTKLELPHSAIPLIWNSMMSFGGGWFFVVQSEMITVLNKNIKLPGIGSYMGTALEKGDSKAATYGAVGMILTIILIDYFFWKPINVWALKFKNEQTESLSREESFVLDIFSKSKLFSLMIHFMSHKLDVFFKFFFNFTNQIQIPARKFKHKFFKIYFMIKVFQKAFYILFLLGLSFYFIKELLKIQNSFSILNLAFVLKLGFLTFLRVFMMVILASLIWTPIGVWVGFHPQLSRWMRPLVQIGASFPINMTYPIMVAFFISHNISLNWGSILLLSLGSQWYILFNVIAGANSIPQDMKETAQIFKLKGFKLWQKMILPAVFPYWVTGACTAAGGAWNASIVAESAHFGSQKLVAEGLGAYIADVTQKGETLGIFISIATMSLFVILINHFIWRNLSIYAAKRFVIEP
jgi:NitT/TauT family transport system permease protein